MSSSERFLSLPEDELRVLRERARHFAIRPVNEESAARVEVLQLTSRGQVYALPMTAVEGAVEFTSLGAIPRGPAFVQGLVTFRGEVLLALELSTLLGQAGSGFGDLRRVIALSARGNRVGVLAEKMLSVCSVWPSAFRPVSLGSSPVVVGTDENLVTLIEPAELIAHAFRQLGGT